MGGARVSFQHLVHYLEKEAVPFYLVETRPFERGWQRLLNPLVVFWRCLKYLPKVDVVWGNMSYGGMKLFGPLLFLLARLGGKKIVLRPFGSRLRETYDALGRGAQSFFRNTVLRADLLFLQTDALINYFAPLSKKLAHLPTSRNAPTIDLPEGPRPYHKRFVYLGHIKQTKGLDEIIAVRDQLPADYLIHLYGPIKEEKYRFLTADDSLYQGVLPSDQVLAKLNLYDVLLLPTYFAGEGYPGVVIEAYALGLPVLSTQWRSIPEIVADGETGRLLPPQRSDLLRQAILAIDEATYARWSVNARQAFAAQFEQDKVLKRALMQIQELLND